MIKNTTGFVVALLLGATLAPSGAACAEGLSDSGVLLDEIVAIVNDGVVLRSELDAQTSAIEMRFRDQGGQLPPRDVLEQQLLERLIVVRAQLQRAERVGLNVPDERLNLALNSIAERNGMTLTQLPAALERQGIDYAAYREEMRREIMLEQLRGRAMSSRVEVSQREIDHYLAREADTGERNDYLISHILLALPSAPTAQDVAEIAAKAEDIHKRLEDGEDFAQLAVAYSAGQSALEGGELGWRNAGQLPTMVTSLVPQMQAGEVTKPIRESSGFHIFRLDDVRGAEKVIVTQRHARHILIQTSEILSADDAGIKLREIRARIEAGEDFAELAREYSDDKGSGSDGGDLGWAAPGKFVPAFEKTLDELKPGEMSEVFRSQFGWHLVELIETREHDSTLDVNRQKAFAAIRERKEEEETQKWLRELRDEAFVELRL